MRGLRWPLLLLAICLPVALLLSGAKLPWLSDSPAKATPVPVPSGDQEIAWIHTTTNATTWERFVTGVLRLPMAMPDVDAGRVGRERNRKSRRGSLALPSPEDEARAAIEQADTYFESLSVGPATPTRIPGNRTRPSPR